MSNNQRLPFTLTPSGKIQATPACGAELTRLVILVVQGIGAVEPGAIHVQGAAGVPQIIQAVMDHDTHRSWNTMKIHGDLGDPIILRTTLYIYIYR